MDEDGSNHYLKKPKNNDDNEDNERLTNSVFATAPPFNCRTNKFNNDNCNNFQWEYNPKPQNLLKWMARKYFAPFRSVNAFIGSLISFFPIFKWLPNYSWRQHFIFDLISGLTTAVMFVPQGIAYAYLAGVEPVYGLYSSFFAPLFYIFLGSSPHISRGPSSVLGIMSCVSNEQIRKSLLGELHSQTQLMKLNATADHSSLALTTDEINAAVPDAITIAAALTFTIGLIQLGMALIKLEFISNYFSEPLIGGYTLAAAVHVLFPQLCSLLGIKVKKGSSSGYLFMLIYDLCASIPNTNWVCALTSFTGIVFLWVGKDFINPFANRILMKHNSLIKITLPYELILMIACAIISQWFDWSSVYNVKVVGEVPRGLPLPSIPSLNLLYHALPNAIEIALVTLAMHFSMIKLFANRLDYSIESSQELYAISFSSILSGCFPVYPTSTALARTMVMVESGAKSQLSSAVSCVVLLGVIFWFGPLFQPLPQCVLSVVIVMALRPIFRKSTEIISLWKLSKYDGLIWLVSFFATVITNVITGLCISVVFTLCTVISRNQWPSWAAKFSTHSFKKMKDDENEITIEYCVFRFDSCLLFTNADRFQKYLNDSLWRWSCARKALQNNDHYKPQLNHYHQKHIMEQLSSQNRLYIFDFSTITQIDSTGIAMLRICLKSILEKKHAKHISFINCRDSVRHLLFEAQIISNLETHFFATVPDAIRSFQYQVLESSWV